MKQLYPHIEAVVKETSLLEGDQDQIKFRRSQILQARLSKSPEVFGRLLRGLGLPVSQLLQESLAGFAGKFILDASRRTIIGLGEEEVPENYVRLDEMAFTLYKTGILFPVASTVVCTNTFNPHYDFLLSAHPVRRGRCRVCASSIITFNMYLTLEPYASLKLEQSDLSYVISADLQNKGSPEIECYPEVFIRSGKAQEQVDVFARNWTNGNTAILECRLRENPRAPFNTQVNILREEVRKLAAKMSALNVNSGYIITNMIFDNEDQEKRVLVEAIKSSSPSIGGQMKLLGKIKGRAAISRMDIVLQDLKVKEPSMSPSRSPDTD
jgi:hypothetical protein